MLDRIEQKYQILEVLGRGGSGTTYSAKLLEQPSQVPSESSSQPIVAIKALPLQGLTDWEPIECFETEVQVLAKLDHPAIPKYLEHFYIDTPQNRIFCIVQEFAEGQSLAERVKQGWRVTEKEVQQIAEQLLEILIYLHEQSPALIHRDIKPENVIYRDDGKVLLVDFGSVQEAYYSTITGDKKTAGTFGYMAPEQFMGRAEPTSDLYGLGATLVFLLTHRSPADLPVDNLRLDFRKCVSSGISERFLDWLEGLLEPDLADRYDSAKKAQQALQNKLTKIEISNFKIDSLDESVRRSTQYLRYIGLSIAWMIASAIAAALISGPIKRLHTPSKPMFLFNLLGALPNQICRGTSNGKTMTDEQWQEAIRTYLENGGNPEANCEGSGGTKLHDFAMWREDITGSQELFELFLSYGADINAKFDDRIPRRYFSANFYVDAAKINGEDASPLHLAMHTQTEITESYPEEAIKFIELLIENGANINAIDKQGRTPLFYYILRGGINESVLDILLSAGADINAQEKNGYTILSLLEAEYDIRARKPEPYLERLKLQISLLKAKGAV